MIHTLTFHKWWQSCIIDCRAIMAWLFWAYVKSLWNQRAIKTGVTWNWQVGATCMIKVQEIDNTRPIFFTYKLDILQNLKLQFKIFQSISLIVCIKMANKCVVIFPSQNGINGDLNVGGCHISFY